MILGEHIMLAVKSNLKSSLCDYSDAYIHARGTITVNNTAAADADASNTNKKVIFKDCAPSTNCISEINNTDLDNAKDLDIVMPMYYNLIEYSDNYSKTSGSLWQYCKDIPAVNNNNAIVDFTNNNLTDSFSFKVKMTGQTGNNGIKNVEIMIPLKYLSNFLRTLEMPLINCEINLLLTWSAPCVIVSTDVANQNATFPIADTKYVPVVTVSQQDNAKLLEQLQSGFKRVINWNKYLSKPELLAQNPNLNHLLEPSFQVINRHFVLAFENNTQRTSSKGYHLPNVEIKNYNVMINGENFFDQPTKDKVTYENITKVAIGEGDDYTNGCLLDYPYFRDNYKMIAVDLSRQQALDAHARAIQQINVTANLDRAGNTRICFILEESKEIKLNFAQGTVKVL